MIVTYSKMIDVSVVIVNYFLSDIISQKIDILLKEDINLEIIIVDNSVDEKEKNSLNKLSNRKIKTIFVVSPIILMADVIFVNPRALRSV